MFTELKSHRAKTADIAIADLMDAVRAVDFMAQCGDLILDYSKTQIDTNARELLLGVARMADVEGRRDAMFSGAKINDTEDRAVLHTALRNLADTSVFVDNDDVMPYIRATRARMADFATAVRNGSYQGAGGQITDVINIGIGGSDLGPVMANLALAPYSDGPRCHFVSNVDPADIADALAQCDPKRTLVIVASKTFATIETMVNAQVVRDWMSEEVDDCGAQFVALSSNLEATAQWGIAPERVFGFEDWVGGRYSIWGPIGLSLMLAVGPADFRDFLAGATAMDRHFLTAPLAENMPVLHALVGIWHHQICGYTTRAVLPYDNRLTRLPAYLQQLEMESNGKGTTRDGAPLESAGPVVWGEPGTNGQHAFYQLIHQGPEVVPCEFFVAARCQNPDHQGQHRILVANCLAQSQALMCGRDFDTALVQVREKMGDSCSEKELQRQARHRVFTGNRPSVTLAYPLLDPYILGQIIALYEHRVFVEGIILDINSFDQWGVELGKELALSVQPGLTGDAPLPIGSTAHLVSYLRDLGL